MPDKTLDLAKDKYVIGVDDTDIVKTMLNHKKLMKEIAAVEKQCKNLNVAIIIQDWFIVLRQRLMAPLP